MDPISAFSIGAAMMSLQEVASHPASVLSPTKKEDRPNALGLTKIAGPESGFSMEYAASSSTR